MDDKPAAGSEDDNQLPLESDDRTVLSAESAVAISTLMIEIERLAGLGDDGLHQLRVLLDAVGEAVFSTGESVIASRQEGDEDVPGTLILFAGRNLEFASRAQVEPDLFASGVRYILREADESMILAHAMAASSLIRTGSSEDLREQGRRAYEECRRIASERGFAPRVEKLMEG